MARLRFSVPSAVMGVPVEIRAFLPEERAPRRVVWLIHGAGSDCNEWMDDSNAARYARERGFALVTLSTLSGFGVNMRYGLPYADFLEKEWLPSVRRILPSLPRERENNFVAGASMGGFSAFRLAMNVPHLFAGAGSFAGSIGMPTILERYERGIQPGGPDMMYAFGSQKNLVGNSNDVTYLAAKRVKEQTCPRLFMVCGTEDFGYALNTISRDDLIHAGADVTWRQGPGTHSYDCWNEWMGEFMDWIDRGAAE